MALICCKACGATVDGLCSCFAKSCDACFSGLSYLLCPINRPSPAPALLSGLVNIGGGVASLVYVLLALGEPCPNPRIWSLVWVGLAAANTIFTCYGYYKLCMAHKDGVPRKTLKLFLYDFGVYLYLWVLLANLVWLILSANWAWPPDVAVCGGTVIALRVGQAFLTVYLVVVGLLVCCLTCSACCPKPGPGPAPVPAVVIAVPYPPPPPPPPSAPVLWPDPSPPSAAPPQAPGYNAAAQPQARPQGLLAGRIGRKARDVAGGLASKLLKR